MLADPAQLLAINRRLLVHETGTRDRHKLLGLRHQVQHLQQVDDALQPRVTRHLPNDFRRCTSCASANLQPESRPCEESLHVRRFRPLHEVRPEHRLIKVHDDAVQARRPSVFELPGVWQVGTK